MEALITERTALAETPALLTAEALTTSALGLACPVTLRLSSSLLPMPVSAVPAVRQ